MEEPPQRDVVSYHTIKSSEWVSSDGWEGGHDLPLTESLEETSELHSFSAM